MANANVRSRLDDGEMNIAIGLFQSGLSQRLVASGDTLLVGAIDFGTTFSGWAYSLYHEFETSSTSGHLKQWHAGSGTLCTEKTPTVVLIRPDGHTLEAFGYDAENRFIELVDNGEHVEYYYFQKFKTKLHRHLSQTIDRHLMLDDEMGKSLPGLDVFAMSIKYLIDDMLGMVNLRISGVLKTSEIKLVLTVPAIWTDAAKQFMREAAEKAGIDNERLSIALEPEAASIFCRHLPIEKTIGGSGVAISSFPTGTRFLVLDAGGGTIDIAVHEINSDGGMKEIMAASGGCWGGTVVDKAFEDLITDMVGNDVYTKFKREEIEDWISLIREFEVKKKNIKPEKDGLVMIRIPSSLRQMSERENNRSLEDYIRNSTKYADAVQILGDKMKIATRMMKGLFENSTERIVLHLTDLLKDTSLNVHTILMVGGYSESPMLQHAVMKGFPDRKVIVPHESSSSILRGALICGHRPDLISERVLKYTYGVNITRAFISGKHPESKRKHYDKGDRCDHIFSKHVEKGQVVKVGVPQVTRSYFNIYKNQTEVAFNMYASTISNPTFVDDEGCTKIGSIKLAEINAGPDWNIDLTFTFGGTEVEVNAEVKQTGQKVKTKVNFLG